MKHFHCLALCCSLLLVWSCQKDNEAAPDKDPKDITDSIPSIELSIGMEYGGGIIFHLDSAGKHGLIVNKDDLGRAPWGCLGLSIPETEADGDGEAHTKSITNACNEPGTGARICADYVVRDLSVPSIYYEDWFLPSRNCLELLATNLKGHRATLTCGRVYLSSNESPLIPGTNPIDPKKHTYFLYNECCATNLFCRFWTRYDMSKDEPAFIRPVRRF